MYNKIKNFSEACWKDRNMFRIFVVACLLWFVATCAFITVNKTWGSLFIYPEQDYKVIQEEADRIISTHDFDTAYQLTITNYSNVYHSLSFELCSNESGAKLTARVKNYGLESEKISYKRMDKTHLTQILKSIFLLMILLPIFLGIFSMYAILIIILIIQFISFIIYKIANVIKPEK